MRIGSHSPSLSVRLIAASIVLALLVALIFVVLINATAALENSKQREAHSQDVVVETLAIQKLVGDVETGLRGLIITRDERSLRPWVEAREALPRHLRALERLSEGNPVQQRRARNLATEINDYVEDYTQPLVNLARETPAVAQSRVARDENRARTEEIRRGITSFLDDERALAAASAASADRQSDRAKRLAIAGLVACAALIVLFGLYLARWIAKPVRDVATGASRVAAGDFSTRLREGGPGEIGELTSAFNRMAAELERSRTELESQNQKLRESERRKSDLVRIVSHELRTPLASVLGFTSVLLTREVGPEEQRRYLEIINAQGRRLSTLVNDFLDADRLEAGALELSRHVIDLGAVVAEQVQLFEGQSSKHKLDTFLPKKELKVDGDPNRLAQVIGNLLSNAIKYSPDGGTVHVMAEQVDSIVRVSVRDEGIGIPEELQQGVFAKFFRGDADASGIPGSGLGLTIARSVVEAHGGRMNFESARGKGSMFWLELPVAAASE